MNFINKTIIFSVICAVLGFLAIRQFYLQEQVKKFTQPETGNSLALEVAEFIKTNDKLRKQVGKLTDQKSKMDQSTANSIVSNETLQENLQNYKIILGLADVEGPGIEITFNDKIDSTQLVDLINAIKNIGADAIAVNNRRFGPRSFVETAVLYPPTSVQIIGNAELLKDSLVRSGGIIEQIGVGYVEKKDKIYLKAIQ